MKEILFSDFFVIPLFLLIAFSVPIAIYIRKCKQRLQDSEGNDIASLADTDMMCVPFKGEWITLSKIEYMNRWPALNRQQRSELLENQKRMLKKGMVRKHHFGEDGAYQILPTDKGKHLQAIHEQKEKIYRGN